MKTNFRRFVSTVTIVAGVLASPVTLPAQVAGSLDAFFIPYSGINVRAVLCMVVQPDGKILIGGDFGPADNRANYNIARLHADGSVESTATFNPGTGVAGNVRCLAVQADGKILTGGEFFTVNGQARAGIARLHANGTLEGTDTFNAGSGANDDVRSLAVQPDGKIIIGGDFTTINGETRNFIARLNPNGALEGTATFNPGAGPNGIVRSVVLQPDGKILIGGDFTAVSGQSGRGIARLNADGTMDTGFGPGATVDNSVRSLALQPDGKVIIVGRFGTVNGSPRNNIARLNPNGTLESTATFTSSTIPDNDVRCVVIQADGKILIGGDFDTVNGLPRKGVARLRPDGTLESTALFNPPSGTNEDVRCMAVQADGKALIGGEFTTVNGQLASGGIGRLLNDTATSTLEMTGLSIVRWLRGGACPEISAAALEVKTAAGADWTPLGDGQRIAGGWTWNISGAVLPATGIMRARGISPAAHGSGIISSSLALGGYTAPGITVRQPGAAALVSGTSVVSFGSDFGRNTRTLAFSVDSIGETPLAGLGVSITGPNAADFTIVNSLPVSLQPSQAATFSVKFDPVVPGLNERSATMHISHNVAGGPFDIPLTGTRIFTLSPVFTDANVWPITRNGFIATGINFGTLTINFAPVPLQYLTVVNNTGTQPISGRFGNLPDSGLVSATFGGRTYEFRAYYSGGDGNDLVLVFIYSGAGAVDDGFTANTSSSVNVIAVQSDGSVIAGGYFSSASGAQRQGIARFLPNGALDTGFNPGLDIKIGHLFIQTDGKIIASENLWDTGNLMRNRLVRLHPNGTLDTGFNPAPNRFTHGIAEQPDGKILITGDFTSVAGAQRNFVARLEANGAVDPNFNPVISGGDAVIDIAPQEDGKILVAGKFSSVGGVPRVNAARLFPNGDVDPSFNVTADAANYISHLALQPDGKILISGSFTSVGGIARNGLARLQPNGSVDLTFDPVESGFFQTTLTVQADGRIFAGPYHLLPDGKTDNGFRVGPFFGGGASSNGYVNTSTLQADGKVLMGGQFNSIGGLTCSNLCRLRNDPATASLLNVGTSGIRWTRGGASPEVTHVTFDAKPRGAANWTPLGAGHRIAGGWELTGLSLPGIGDLRARGRAGGSVYESIEPIRTPLEQWRQKYFGTAANTGSAADAADPDFDTIPNLVEYALGLNPNQNSAGSLPRGEVTGDDFVLTVTQPVEVSGITCGAEWSTTMLPGSWSAVPDTGFAPQHSFRVRLGANPKIFLRLKVVSP